MLNKILLSIYILSYILFKIKIKLKKELNILFNSFFEIIDNLYSVEYFKIRIFLIRI